MLPYDIAAIRAVHSDRIRRDLASHVHDSPARAPSRSIRRPIGHLMVRIGVWLSEGAASPQRVRVPRG
jgi:hypothetical protein